MRDLLSKIFINFFIHFFQINISVIFGNDTATLVVTENIHIDALLNMWLEAVELTPILLSKISLTRNGEVLNSSIVHLEDDDILKVVLESVSIFSIPSLPPKDIHFFYNKRTFYPPTNNSQQNTILPTKSLKFKFPQIDLCIL